MADPHAKHEPIGLAEVGERLDASRDALAYWLDSGLLPDPRWTVSERPACAGDVTSNRGRGGGAGSDGGQVGRNAS
jgi:hypothetical protein